MKKHIVCFGDSNTHGYCADPSDCADGCICPERGYRFNEQERWTMLLQDLLGSEYQVIEEGLSGRTTVFDDPLGESLSGIDCLYSCLVSHEPLDLLVIMLGTNDTKERFAASPECIVWGMERLVQKAKAIAAWSNNTPNILVISPPHINEALYKHHFYKTMGTGCIEKSQQLAVLYKELCEKQGCAFLDAEGIAEFNRVDGMHLSKKGHSQLADALAPIVKNLVK